MEKKSEGIWSVISVIVLIISLQLVRYTFKNDFGIYLLPYIFMIMVLVSFFSAIVLLFHLFVGNGNIVEKAESKKLFSKRGLYLVIILFFVLSLLFDFITKFKGCITFYLTISSKKYYLRITYALGLLIMLCLAFFMDKIVCYIKSKFKKK